MAKNTPHTINEEETPNQLVSYRDLYKETSSGMYTRGSIAFSTPVIYAPVDYDYHMERVKSLQRLVEDQAFEIRALERKIESLEFLLDKKEKNK